MSIDNALRTVCAKLLLKGEAQTLDRVVFQISTRYWLCNPASHQRFYNIDVVLGIFFSLVLLITDFTVAGHKKMTLKEYVKNSIDAVEQNVTLDEDSMRKWKLDLEVTKERDRE